MITAENVTDNGYAGNYLSLNLFPDPCNTRRRNKEAFDSDFTASLSIVGNQSALFLGQLNDAWGHQAGGHVLCELAKILKSVSRETYVVVRYGGDEFIVILPNRPEEDTIFLADRIRDSVEKHVFLPGHAGGLHIALSGGSLLNASDVAPYSAKAAGKNRIICLNRKDK